MRRDRFSSSSLLPAPSSLQRGISRRAVLLGLALTVLNVWWVTLVEVRYYILDGSSLPLFVTPVFLLLLLVVANAAATRLFPRRALRQEEMLTAYLMAVISNAFAGHDMLQNFFGSVTHPYYFARPENGWQDLFLRSLPRGLYVTDEQALDFWYRGNVAADRATGYLVHWSVPLTLWGVFFLVLAFLFGCVTVLFRKAWTENERLAFPIIQLPLAMTEPGGDFWKNGRMWIGFAAAFLIGLLNGIHELYPSVPNAPWIKLYNVGQFFTTGPWEAIRSYGMQTSLYPFAIGLAYFIPLDLAFSCWCSYLLARGYFVVGRAAGWDGPSAAQGWPFLREISSGAWIGLAAALLWAHRRYLARAFDLAFAHGKEGRALRAEDPAEARRYRAAWLGIGVGLLFLLFWGNFVGLSPAVALGFFGILFALSLAITRVRAEFGTPHEIVFVKPADVLVTLFGTNTLGQSNLVGMQTMYWFNRGYRCHPMPNYLEGFKMAEGRDMPFARLVGVLALASLVSLLAAFAANYFVTYDVGATGKAQGYKRWVGNEAFNQLANWLRLGQAAGASNFWFFVGGLTLVGALAALRASFLWWPLHPAGFALGISYAMNYFWLCVFVAWLAKLLIIRYGGMNAHRRAIPFFLGLILGDYTIGALWSLLALYLEQATYKIYI
jgi:hypothetical protein